MAVKLLTRYSPIPMAQILSDLNHPSSPMISHALFLLSLIAATAVAGGEAAAYKPIDLFLFNCGASSDLQSLTGRTWTAEDPKLLSSNSANASFPSTATVQDRSVPRVPYITARIFRSEFTYSFSVSGGWKFVRLYFYPTQYDTGFDAVTSFFSVTANGFTLMRNFSAHLTVSFSGSKSLIKEFIVPVLDGGQTLNLTFKPAHNSSAFVNGVEIVSMPDGLYTNGGLYGIKYVDSSVGFDIDNTTTFETVHRLNVGGSEIDGVNDTGMFRRWKSDWRYVLGAYGGLTENLTGVRIKYKKNTPAYVAPEIVYTTSRTMGNVNQPSLNVKFRLSWVFAVDTGFNYLIRLHFFETLQEVTEPGQHVFSIFVGNQTATLDADVIQWSGGRNIPVFRDFVKLMAPNGGGSYGPNLQIDLLAFADSKPVYYDGILNGVEILKLNDTNGNLAGPNPELMKSPEPNQETSAKIEDKKKSSVVVITLPVISCTFGLTFVIVVVLFMCQRRRKKMKGYGTNASSLPSDLCRRFSIIEIRSATDDFDHKLVVGVGGFGTVYRGRINGGSTLVAIKRLGMSSSQGAQEFETEIQMLSKLRHIHLVSLIGYCDDQNEMILVYDYMSLGTLKDHLYTNDDSNSNPPLTWKQRLEICIGAARGLQYLHTGVEYPIIHRDIKSTNILLDENYVAKLSDFGLSKIGPTSTSQTHVSTVVKGSIGYLDPEYYRRQHLTEKSDVYSFGVVLFEVLCGRPITVRRLPKDQVNLTQWAKLNHSRGTVDQIVDPNLTDDITPTSLDRFCEIAVRCVQDRATERPTMNDIVWALEFALQLHKTAKKNDNVDGLNLIKVDKGLIHSPRGEMGRTAEEDPLFIETTTHLSVSTTADGKSPSRHEHDRDGFSLGAGIP